MSAYLSTGAGFTRELSLLQRNVETHPDGIVAALARRLSAELNDLPSVPGQPQGGGSDSSARSPNQ